MKRIFNPTPLIVLIFFTHFSVINIYILIFFPSPFFPKISVPFPSSTLDNLYCIFSVYRGGKKGGKRKFFNVLEGRNMIFEKGGGKNTGMTRGSEYFFLRSGSGSAEEEKIGSGSDLD